MTLSPRTRTVLAWLLFAATFGCLAAGLAVALVLVRPLTLAVLAEGALAAALYLGFAVLGLVLSLRRPGNPIGWLLAASGLVWSLNVPGEAWVSNLAATGRPLPRLAQVHAAVLEPLWAPAIALGVTLPLLLLPDGRLRSPRWRWAVAASVAGGVLSMASALGPGQLVSTPIANPLALDGLGGVVAGAVAGLGGLLHAASLAAALVCMVLRFRSSRGVERQQLRWVPAGAAVAVVGLLAVVALLALEETYGFAPGAWLVALALALPSLPVAIGVETSSPGSRAAAIDRTPPATLAATAHRQRGERSRPSGSSSSGRVTPRAIAGAHRGSVAAALTCASSGSGRPVSTRLVTQASPGTFSDQTRPEAASSQPIGLAGRRRLMTSPSTAKLRYSAAASAPS
ncbi:MAG TPA: hypothetical protein VFQ04_12335, partial [Actinomycetes bacterium]|nr:hypothetical protein [Actinomycetes bacterium]